MNLVLSRIVTERTGYTKYAIDHKRNRGIWLEGIIWFRVPDGTIQYDMEAIEKWQRTGVQELPHGGSTYKFSSSSRGGAAGRLSDSRQPAPT